MTTCVTCAHAWSFHTTKENWTKPKKHDVVVADSQQWAVVVMVKDMREKQIELTMQFFFIIDTHVLCVSLCPSIYVDDDNSPDQQHETESGLAKRRRRHQHRTHQVSVFELPTCEPQQQQPTVATAANNSSTSPPPTTTTTHKQQQQQQHDDNDVMFKLSAVQSKEDLAKSMCNLAVTPPIAPHTVNNVR